MAEAIPEDRLEVPPQDIQTLTGLLNWHAAHHGERTHVTLYSDGEQVHNISYRALQQDAQKIAAGLLALGLEAGSRVAIMLPTCREFLAVFYGPRFMPVACRYRSIHLHAFRNWKTTCAESPAL